MSPYWANALTAEPHKVIVGTGEKSKTFFLHLQILSQSSQFFSSLQSFPGKEREDRTIELPEDDVEAFELFVHHAYTGEFSYTGLLWPITYYNGEKLALLAETYILADKLLTNTLKRAALESLLAELRNIKLQEEKQPDHQLVTQPVRTGAGLFGARPAGNATSATSRGFSGAPGATPATNGLFGSTSARTPGVMGSSAAGATTGASATGALGISTPTVNTTVANSAASGGLFGVSTTSTTSSATKALDTAPPNVTSATIPEAENRINNICDATDILYSHFSGQVKDNPERKSSLLGTSAFGTAGDGIFKSGYDPAKLLLARYCSSKFTLLSKNARFMKLLARHVEFLRNIIELVTVVNSSEVGSQELDSSTFMAQLTKAAQRAQ